MKKNIIPLLISSFFVAPAFAEPVDINFGDSFSINTSSSVVDENASDSVSYRFEIIDETSGLVVMDLPGESVNVDTSLLDPNSTYTITAITSDGVYSTESTGLSFNTIELTLEAIWQRFASDNGLEWTDGNTLNWANKSLTEIPTENYPVVNPTGDINLSSNSLSNIDSLASIESVNGNLYLYSNNLTHVNGLSNLTYVGGYLHLSNNTALDDLSGLSSIVGIPDDRVNLSNKSFTTKVPSTSWICDFEQRQKFRGWTNTSYAKQNQACDTNYSPTSWENLVVEESLAWTDGNSLNWGNKNLGSLPSDSYPVSNPTGDISLYGNSLSNIDSLSSITSVGGHLYLYSNNLTEVGGLSNLTSVGGYLHLSNNAALDDLSGLANIASIPDDRVNLSNKSFTTKVPSTSWICDFEQRQKFRGWTNTSYAKQNQACDTNYSPTSWENFVVERSLDWTDGNNLNWYNEGLTELPSDAYPLSSLSGSINLGYNSLSNVDSLSSVTSVLGGLNLSVNALTDVSGLSNLTSVSGVLTLNANNLTSISSLTNLVSVGDLQISGNNLTNLHGLTNLANITGALSIKDNPNLSDISGLANITSTQSSSGIYLDNQLFDIKIPSSAWLCQSSQEERFRGYFDSNYATQGSACEAVI